MLTSAVLGTDSQKTSILMSPVVVCSVTDMAGDKRYRCSAHYATRRALMNSRKNIGILKSDQPYRTVCGLDAALASWPGVEAEWSLLGAWLSARQRNLQVRVLA